VKHDYAACGGKLKFMGAVPGKSPGAAAEYVHTCSHCGKVSASYAPGTEPFRVTASSAARASIIQIFAGKAHPQDREGKELIQRIFAY
jgi:hypothetical protein